MCHYWQLNDILSEYILRKYNANLMIMIMDDDNGMVYQFIINNVTLLCGLFQKYESHVNYSFG